MPAPTPADKLAEAKQKVEDLIPDGSIPDAATERGKNMSALELIWNSYDSGLTSENDFDLQLQLFLTRLEKYGQSIIGGALPAATPLDDARAKIRSIGGLSNIERANYIRRLEQAERDDSQNFDTKKDDIIKEADEYGRQMRIDAAYDDVQLKPPKEDWNTKYLEKRGFVSSEDEQELVQEAPRSSWATSSNTSYSEKEISENEMVHVDDTWAADTTSGNESAVEESTSKEIRALWATTSSGTDVTSSGTDDLVWASQSETDDDKLDTMISLLHDSSNAAWASEEDD